MVRDLATSGKIKGTYVAEYETFLRNLRLTALFKNLNAAYETYIIAYDV